MFRILLIGDDCTDVYRYGSVDRISPEAPVPVFKFSYEESKPGMAGNVLRNLEAFGLEVKFITAGQASTKTRIIDTKSKQHIIRIDDDADCQPLLPDFISQEELALYNAIVISDYNKGTISYEIVEWLRSQYQGLIFIDTKKRDLIRFNDCIVKVNEHEYSQRTSLCNNIIVTLGANGAMHKREESEDFYPGYKVEVVDVCGAGDTFLSALVYKYLENSDISQAILFANRASSIAVQHSGVYTLNKSDIEQIIFDTNL